MTSSPITSRQMGKPWKQWQTLFPWAPKALQIVTAVMKLRYLLLGRKAMANLDSILKSRVITLSTKLRLVKAMVFLVVMYGCESWTIEKAKCQGIDAFELWCWRRLLRVPWTARRYNQSILKEISPQYSLEGLMLKLKLQYFGHLMWRTGSLKRRQEEKEMTEDEMVGWYHWLDGHEFEQALRVGNGQESLVCFSPWITNSRTQLSDWTEYFLMRKWWEMSLYVLK